MFSLSPYSEVSARALFCLSVSIQLSLTESAGMHKGLSPLCDRLPALTGTPAGVSGFKLATGDVHLVNGGGQALWQHAWAVGEHVEAAIVLQNVPVHTAPVTLALIVCLDTHRERSVRGATCVIS